ncbi:hypothetical protein MTR67_040989, partial [Solanum verrucosum]
KSKATWIKLDDDNTKYFHSITKHRRLHQGTTQLKDDQGAWQTDPTQIANIFVKYYTELLGTKTDRRSRASMRIIQNGPCLTVDHQIELLRPFSRKEVKEIMFKTDSNKSPRPEGFGSGFYKTAWPIIEDDITRAIMDFFQNGRLLKQLNATIIALIPKVDNPEFARQRGLRQGDPASPFLFVLVMEYLSRTLKTMSMLPDFRFHSMGKELKLTHLTFADDLMIFCKANGDSVNRVMKALSHFNNVFGLVANMEKSSIFVAGVKDHVKNELLLRTGFTLGEFPIRYLGLPLSSKRWSKLECQQLVEKIKSRSD